MVLVNEEVAKMLRGKLGGVYRIHERPSAEDMETLRTRLAAVGVQVEPTPENLGLISQKAKSNAINYLILRSIPRAFYSPAPLGHYGLALQDYTHFTSPIRRYSDVLVHRALLGDEPPENLEGTVVSTAAFGLFMELETGATGLVHVSKLPGWWELEPSGVVLSNEAIGSSYRVGDRVLVELVDVLPLMQRAELRVVKRL